MRSLPALAALVLLTGCTSGQVSAPSARAHVGDVTPGPADEVAATPSSTSRAPSTPSSPARGPSTGPPAWVSPPPQCAGWLATVVGTAGADQLRGTPGADVVLAGGGDDRVTGVGEDDRVCTGGGDDQVRTSPGESAALVLLGAGDDVFRGASWRVDPGPGRDLVVLGGLPGADPDEAGCVHFAGARRGITADLTGGWARGQGTDRLRGVHCLVGTAYADHLTGSPGPDRLVVCETASRALETRRNTVSARAGDDEVVGCEGPDVLVLGAGADTGIGGAGPDTVLGGPGSDDLLGLAGVDRLDGGPGRDDGCRGPVRDRGADVTTSVERLTPCP